MHAEFPPADSGRPDDDEVERILRGLPAATLPPAWRGIILRNPPFPPSFPKSPEPSGTRFFTRKFVSLMAGIWGFTAFLHFTTPEPPPRRDGDPLPEFPPARVPSPFGPPGGEWDPWLAQIQTPQPRTGHTP